MVSVKDVAREVGLSVGTVSAVLNGKSTVKPENIQRVMAAVEKLGYRPNMVARSLRTKKTNSLGLILPDITNPYYPELERGVQDATRDAGFTLLVCNSDRKADEEWYHVQALMQKNVDGILITKPQISASKLAALRQYCPIFLIDGDAESYEDFDMINVDNKSGIHAAFDLLYENGHRKIAFLGGLFNSQSMLQRREAYLESLREHGLPYRPEWVAECDYTWQSSCNAVNHLLAADGEKPTAYIAGNDILAFGAIRGILNSGLRVPEDCSVCGFDDIAMAELCSPALTTVRQPKYEIGKRSTELLLKKISGVSLQIHREVMDTSLVLRQTVAPCINMLQQNVK